MNNTSKTQKIEKFLKGKFKDLFNKYSNLDSFSITIHNFPDGFYCCEENIYINGKSWDEYGDSKLYNIKGKIKNLIKDLESVDINLYSLKKSLESSKEDVDAHLIDRCPLMNIWTPYKDNKTEWDIINKSINSGLNSKMKLVIKNSFSWKYIKYIQVTLFKNGDIKFEESPKYF